MKKIFATLLAATCALSMIGCGGGSSSGTASTAAKTEDPSAKSEGVMTYAEYDAAELDTGVTIETYVQGKQSWWDNKATLYTQDGDGGYFIFEMPMSEEEYKKLTDGTKIKVKGFKSEWSGEIEIVDATYEIEEGNYIAEAKDVTDKLGTDDLIKFQKFCQPVYGIDTVKLINKPFGDAVINKFGYICVDHRKPPSDYLDAAVFTDR